MHCQTSYNMTNTQYNLQIVISSMQRNQSCPFQVCILILYSLHERIKEKSLMWKMIFLFIFYLFRNLNNFANDPLVRSDYVHTLCSILVQFSRDKSSPCTVWSLIMYRYWLLFPMSISCACLSQGQMYIIKKSVFQISCWM